jgi:hypothetical protein
MALFWREKLQSPHVVQPISQLHQNDTDVIHHGQKHLAEVFRLLLFLGIELKLVDLGKTVNDVRDVLAELFLNNFQRGLKYLNNVVQQPPSHTGPSCFLSARLSALPRGVVDVRFSDLRILSVVLFGERRRALRRMFRSLVWWSFSTFA